MQNWYILLTEPCRELVAAEKLVARGHSAYCPARRTRVPTGRRDASGKKQTRERKSALFPGYGFVTFERGKEDWPAVEAVPGVRRFLTIEGRPAALPGVLMEAIANREADELARYLDSLKVRSRAPFEPGQLVRVKEGPFAAFVASVDSLDDRGRVTALLSIFGRSSRIKFDGEVLEAA